MNTRKGFLVGLAAVVAASAAVSVNAATLGNSTEEVVVDVVAGEEAVVNAVVETEAVTANINVRIQVRVIILFSIPAQQ